MNGNSVLVAGASFGIGNAITQQLLHGGNQVIALSRHINSLRLTYRNTKGDIILYECDARDVQKTQDLAKIVEEKHGVLCALINCVGGNGIIKDMMHLTDEEWQADLSENFFSIVHLCTSFLPLMRSGGRVVNISSIAGVQPNMNYIPYCVAKNAVISYTKALAEYFASEGILINAILPGLVDTRQMGYVEESMSKDAHCSIESTRLLLSAQIPIGRYAKAEEIAKLAIFLASEENTYMTGGAYIIDGGMSVKTNNFERANFYEI